MAKRLGALTGKSAKRVGIAVAVVIALIAIPAIADAVSIDTTGEVFKDKCTPCHGNYNETDNPKYVFTHGNHITYQCSTCHPEFPHKPNGTDLPVMKDCFNCHGLSHGPQGVIATGECVDCHGDRIEGTKPASHNSGWPGKGHVDPANEGLTTHCSMCHTKQQCDSCHIAENIFWKPEQPMVYDAGSGCLACHSSPNLIKSSSLGLVSFQVLGLEASAHRDLACPDCHIDFAYGDVKAPTKVWSINAGLSCAEAKCHDHDEIAAQWKSSIHGTTIAGGDLTGATCGSCHGGHNIQRLNTESAKRALHLAGETMCKSCHEERWNNYDDPYHGAAYKASADDAPACWGCHPAHGMLASSHPESTTNFANLAETCASCHQHKNASESFVKQTSGMIHQQFDTRNTNPIYNLLPMLKPVSRNGGS